MYRIAQVEVDRFRGEADLRVNFHPHANFIIGKNGSGKTTFINLLNAVLSVDLRTIADADFSSARIRLISNHNRARPVIDVEKALHSKGGVADIKYILRNSARSQGQEHLFSGFPAFRRRGSRYASRRYYAEYAAQALALQNVISEKLNFSWLSVHRGTIERTEPLGEYESAVDLKVSEIGNECSRYFAELSTRANEPLDRFVQEMFLSFIQRPNPRPVYHRRRRLDLDLDHEKHTLQQIFKQFKMEPSRFLTQLEDHFNRIKEALKREENDRYSMEDFVLIVTSLHTHELVEKWENIQKEIDQIVKPREPFRGIIDSLFGRKQLKIAASGELSFIIEGKHNDLQLFDLSSGEKQMLILLGQVLLQRASSAVFLADEPELSLHLEWQADLVRNMLFLNPNCQLIFATHSPDIVSDKPECAIDMEDVIR